jgi:anti-sigma regulatory factor (Ser/Thr protein kinase)
MSRYSTKPSMGLGYSLMLATVDKVYLATSKNGTSVLMEKKIAEAVDEFSLDLLPVVW